MGVVALKARSIPGFQFDKYEILYGCEVKPEAATDSDLQALFDFRLDFDVDPEAAIKSRIVSDFKPANGKPFLLKLVDKPFRSTDESVITKRSLSSDLLGDP